MQRERERVGFGVNNYLCTVKYVVNGPERVDTTVVVWWCGGVVVWRGY
jgi:hypothetical protein